MTEFRKFLSEDGSEIEMESIKAGDRFRIVTDHPEDHLFGQSDRVWTAKADAVEDPGDPSATFVEVDEGA